MESKCKVCDRPATLVKSGDTPSGGHWKEFQCKKGHEVVIRIRPVQETLPEETDRDVELLRELNARLRRRRKSDVQ